jgi:uncharacterized protein YjbI with pentapeptide repeats
MANQEQLALLKKGVQAWNRWRGENPDEEIDLIGADLRGKVLARANLRKAQLTAANLERVSFLGADLSRAELRGAKLSHAYLEFANLRHANLHTAILFNTRCHRVDLTEANLSEADLQRTTLHSADLSRASLKGSNFMDARIQNTIFVNLDLSAVMKLDAVHHDGPSTLGTNTFVLSKGKIPEAFLRGCGLSDWEIEQVKLYNPDLSNEEINNIQYKVYGLRASQALQISPLFISYSHADSAFVDKLENHLNEKGIRFWRDIHEMKAGRVETQIDRAISQNRTVLLVLSKHSTRSDWVEHEVRTARELEKETRRDVLCPVALDNIWKESHWPKRIIEQIREYNVLDFSAWEDDSKFLNTFKRLIDGLDLFYKG